MTSFGALLLFAVCFGCGLGEVEGSGNASLAAPMAASGRLRGTGAASKEAEDTFDVNVTATALAPLLTAEAAKGGSPQAWYNQYWCGNDHNVVPVASKPGLVDLKEECFSACAQWLRQQGASNGCCAAETHASGSCWASLESPSHFWSTTVYATPVKVWLPAWKNQAWCGSNPKYMKVLDFPQKPPLAEMKVACSSACTNWLGAQGLSDGCCAAETYQQGSCWVAAGVPTDFWSTTVFAAAIWRPVWRNQQWCGNQNNNIVLTFAVKPGLDSMKTQCLSACMLWLTVHGASAGCCAAETVDEGSCWASVGAPQEFWSTTVHATAVKLTGP